MQDACQLVQRHPASYFYPYRRPLICFRTAPVFGDDVTARKFYFSLVSKTGKLTKRPSLPAGLDPTFLDEIPGSAGVYLFHGENDLPLYIGKSVTLRARVISHFSGDHASSRAMRIGQQVRRVEWMETAGVICFRKIGPDRK